MHDNFADTSNHVCATSTCNFFNNTVVNTAAGDAWQVPRYKILPKCSVQRLFRQQTVLCGMTNGGSRRCCAG